MRAALADTRCNLQREVMGASPRSRCTTAPAAATRRLCASKLLSKFKCMVNRGFPLPLIKLLLLKACAPHARWVRPMRYQRLLCATGVQHLLARAAAAVWPQATLTRAGRGCSTQRFRLVHLCVQPLLAGGPWLHDKTLN